MLLFRSPRRDRRDNSAPRRSTGPPRGGGGGGGGGGSRRAPPERRIFVSNIPFEMKWQEVKDLFREKVGDVDFVKLFPGMYIHSLLHFSLLFATLTLSHQHS